MSSFSESFIPSGKQGEAVVLGEEGDTVTGETCIPAFLNTNNLGEAAVLHFLFCGQGCANLNLQINILGKAIELHLTLLMSSSHGLIWKKSEIENYSNA
jgi:hypothetical protein